MENEIQKFINEHIKYENIESFEFQEIYGFTLVFKRKIKTLNNELVSGEIFPIGIIYSEHDDFYFAPLVNEIDCETIIKKYVETI